MVFFCGAKKLDKYELFELKKTKKIPRKGKLLSENLFGEKKNKLGLFPLKIEKDCQ